MIVDLEDTIAAIATAPGEGGVGIVRLSGPEALSIAARLFRSSRGRNPLQSAQRVFHGHLYDVDGTALDEVLLHCMRAPHSYTREDVVEINAHGGMGPLNAILEALLSQGARLARPGEFTQRAFLNGRIDLVQAEAVMDQIRARTRTALQAAQAAASGVLSGALHTMGDTLRHALAHIEAAVDFPDEDLPDLVDEGLLQQLRDARDRMRDLLATADAGRLCREGVTVAIVGRPNVGKSSLFNALLRDARAIVTAQAGTTRDRLEEYITIEGIPVRLVDTAGVRATEDEVELLGVERSRDAMRTAQIILLVVDATDPATEEDRQLTEELAPLGLPVVLVVNKVDLAPPRELPSWGLTPCAVAPLSAATGEGLHALERLLGEKLLGGAHLSADQAMLNRAHQKDSLRRALEHLERLLSAPHLSPEFLAADLRDALNALGEITGETTPEDILDTIFSSFCIGK